MTEQERALVQAIREQPEDDALRLIYADWLQDRGDPRGEFIHAQVRWHQARQAGDHPAMRRHSEQEYRCAGSTRRPGWRLWRPWDSTACSSAGGSWKALASWARSS